MSLFGNNYDDPMFVDPHRPYKLSNFPEHDRHFFSNEPYNQQNDFFFILF